MRLVAFTLALFAAVPVYSVDNAEATKFCERFVFQSDRTDCLQAVASGHYEDDAVRVCSGLNYESDRRNCFSSIRNRTFGKSEVDQCAASGLESDRLNCLGQRGRPLNAVYLASPLIYLNGQLVTFPRPSR